MKKRFCIAAFLATLLLTAGFPFELAADTGAGGGKSTELACHDPNKDGKIDLGDVIYLLTYLYLGGPAPKACNFGKLVAGSYFVDGKSEELGDFKELLTIFSDGTYIASKTMDFGNGDRAANGYTSPEHGVWEWKEEMGPREIALAGLMFRYEADGALKEIPRVRGKLEFCENFEGFTASFERDIFQPAQDPACGEPDKIDVAGGTLEGCLVPDGDCQGKGETEDFLCYDANGDGKAVDLSDAIYILQYRYLGGPAPTCPQGSGEDFWRKTSGVYFQIDNVQGVGVEKKFCTHFEDGNFVSTDDVVFGWGDLARNGFLSHLHGVLGKLGDHIKSVSILYFWYEPKEGSLLYILRALGIGEFSQDFNEYNGAGVVDQYGNNQKPCAEEPVAPEIIKYQSTANRFRLEGPEASEDFKKMAAGTYLIATEVEGAPWVRKLLTITGDGNFIATDTNDFGFGWQMDIDLAANGFQGSEHGTWIQAEPRTEPRKAEMSGLSRSYNSNGLALQTFQTHYAVEFTEDGRCRVVLLDARSGQRLKIIPNPDNAYLMTPAWSEDGRRLALVRQSAQGRGLMVVDPEAGSTIAALADGPEAVTDPALFGRFLLYHSPYSGIDNIYALDLDTGRRWQVTSARFGAFHPEVSAGGNRLYFSNYTAEGFDLAVLPLDPAAWKKIEDVEVHSVQFAGLLAAQEQGESTLNLKPAPPQDYPLTDYSPSAHLFNVHSWGLIPTLTEANLLFLSNDLLNKASLTAGVNWNYNEKTLGFGLAASYRALYPVIELEADYSGRSTTLEDQQGQTYVHNWHEASARTGLLVPLNLSRGVYSSSLTLAADISLRKVWDPNFENSHFPGNGTLLPLSYSLVFSRIHQASTLDLRPPFGQFLTLAFRHTPFHNAEYRGRLLSASAGAYLPGLVRHHSLRLAAAFEEQDPSPYRFESEFIFPRGYDFAFHRNLAKLSVDYALPLAYPDVALGRYLYLKRLSLNLFFDCGRGSDPGRRVWYRSAGLDFLADVHFFRLPVTINLGLRLAYRFTDRIVRFEPLVLGMAI